MQMCISRKLKKNFCEKLLCNRTLDTEISQTDGNQVYANKCYITISKFSFREVLY